MKIKVRKDKLKAAIVKFVEKDDQRFRREFDEYTEKLKAARAQYVIRLTEYLAEVKRGGEILESYDLSNHLSRGCKFPKEPKEAKDFGVLIQRLDMSEDAVLLMDDHCEYMRFLAGECICK